MQANSAANGREEDMTREELLAAWDEGEPVQIVGTEIPMFCAACGKKHPPFAQTNAYARPYVCPCGSSKFTGTVTFRG